MLNDNIQHVFIASSAIDMVEANGAKCSITQGDALQLSAPSSPRARAANLVVLSSKAGPECHKGAMISVALVDLQEMQNNMRETIDQGLADLETNQSKGGLPAVPASAQAAPTKASFTAEAPAPDANVADQINQQWHDSDASTPSALNQSQPVLADVRGQNLHPATPIEPPKTITLGQTVHEVTSLMGEPKTVMDLGVKRIYVYSDMKITFIRGKVSDLQ
jgi:hypothetical protein